MAEKTLDKPVRVGIFNTIEAAEEAVKRLQAAGLKKEELAVICSDKYKEQFFKDVPTPEPAGMNTRGAVVAGGAVGAAIGGLVMVVSALATGGASLLIAGPAMVGGAALAGSFAGAMLTRGFEKEIANYYDQAVQRGQILVAAEVHGKGHEARLAEAERIIAECGAEPVVLSEG